MTGFGGAESSSPQWSVRAETRSVNRKDLSITFRLPDVFYLKENELRKLFEQKISRGNVYVILTCEPREGSSGVLVDEDRLRDYIGALRRLAEAEGLPFAVDLTSLLRLPGALRDLTQDENLRDQLWPQVLAATQGALDALVTMRRAEGENLRHELATICQAITDRADAIEKAQETFVDARHERLKERLEKLLGGEIPVPEEVLARELAIFADRCDVSEEIARIRSHLKQFREALEENGEPVGRKLEFLVQELMREAGTTAAKVPDGPHVKDVLELKGQIERLRQQIHNVE